MKIFCSPKVLAFFQNDGKGDLTQARLNSWLDSRELRPGEACMPRQVEHFRFRETELAIHWVGFKINDAARLIGAVVDVPDFGRCFFALDLTETHDYQKTLVENPSLRHSHLYAIKTFLSSGDAIAASSSSSSSAALSASADTPHSFKRMVQHGSAWLSPDVTQIELMDMPIYQGALCFAPPGAGKTMLGVQRAKDYVEQGLTVAMCTPTRRLADVMKAEFAEQGIADSVRVLTFEDVLGALGIARGETLVDFECFAKWCTKYRPEALEKLAGTLRKSFNTAVKEKSLPLLWQEFEYVFMQSPDWRKPSCAHLSESQYCELGTEQSRITQEQRANIHQSVFAPFLAKIEANPKLYYPPLEAHKLYQKGLSTELKVDALVIDEVQKVHPWVSACFLKLLNKPLAAGQFFICGDAHQGAECQQLRVAETLTKYLVGQEASVLIGHLLVNHRSSQAVTRVVLQTHAIEMALLGSMEKTTHLRPEVNYEGPEGRVELLPYNAEIRELIQSDAEAYVLIPDESSRKAAVQRWPAGQVVTLGEFAGLSGKSIVMYGFGEYFQKDLVEIGALFGDESLPSWNTHRDFSRKGNNYAQRTCLQSIYTAASRAMVALYIVDSQPCFLRKIVANSCLDEKVSAVSAAARVSTPQEWFVRAYSDFSNNLIGNAREILLDKTKMGVAYQKINEALKSFELASVLSMPFSSYLPVEMAPQPSVAGGAYKRAGSNSPPPAIKDPASLSSGSVNEVQASAAGGGHARPKPKNPPPQEVLSSEEQDWVNEFSPTAQKLKELVTMKDKWPGFREHLLFVAKAQDGKRESIFIQCVEAGFLKSLLTYMEKQNFLSKITSLDLNYMCKGEAYFNRSLIYFLCSNSAGIALLGKHPGLAAKIDANALNAVLPDSAEASAGKSGTYFLCASPEGRKLLRDNPGLAVKIDDKSLNAVLSVSAGADAGMSGTFFLCIYPECLALLRGKSGLVAKIDKKALNAVLPVSAGPYAGMSGTYLLCASPGGRVLLGGNPGLVAKIDEKALNTVLPCSATDAGMSGTYLLCASPRGRVLLGDNPGLVAKIDKKALNTVLPCSAENAAGTSGTYFLCDSPEGLELLRGYSGLVAKIDKEALNAVLPESAGALAGKSGTYSLCGSREGLELLSLYPDLVAKIDGKALNALLPESARAEAGNSCVLTLCANPEGRALLRGNPDLVAKIDGKALNALLPVSARADAGKSGTSFLCGSREGLELLSLYPDLVAKIDGKALNALLPESARAEAGISCVLTLCANPEGRALLRGNPDLVAKIDGKALNALLPESARAEAGMSGASFLCGSREGLELLSLYPDLVAKIDGKALNALLPESARANAGMSCAYFLCASPEGRVLLRGNPHLVAKIDKKALNAVLPVSAGPDAGKSGAHLLLENPDGRALLKNNAQLRSMINTACGWPFSSNFKDDNKGETIESWLAQYNEEGELPSKSPSAASVSMFTSSEPGSRASSPSRNL